MYRIPGAENRMPGAFRKFRQRQGQLVPPVRQSFGPRDRPFIQHQFEIAAVRMKRHRDREIVGALLLIHLREDPNVIGKIRQPDGEAVGLTGIQERQIREKALSGAAALDRPVKFGRGRPRFGDPVSVHIQDRDGEAKFQNTGVSGDRNLQTAVIACVFQTVDFFFLMKYGDFHLIFLSTNSGWILSVYGEAGAFPSSMSARRLAAFRDRSSSFRSILENPFSEAR